MHGVSPFSLVKYQRTEPKEKKKESFVPKVGRFSGPGTGTYLPTYDLELNLGIGLGGLGFGYGLGSESGLGSEIRDGDGPLGPVLRDKDRRLGRYWGLRMAMGSVLDPKLFVSDPDQAFNIIFYPAFQIISDPDPGSNNYIIFS